MKGEVALVTGGARGIGRGIAAALAREGGNIAVGYRTRSDAARAVVEEIQTMGGRGVAIGADLGDPAAGERLVAETVAQLGRLDVLVSNAGCVVRAPFLETTPEAYDWQQETNTRGSFFVAQAAAKQMIAQGDGGRIVFVTSRAAHRAVQNLSAYCISKAGQKMLTETLALELADHGITVNAVAPGTTETDMNRDLLADPETRKTLLGRILLGRPGTPEDIAAAVCFLTSDRAGHVTGCTIAVDGGAGIN